MGFIYFEYSYYPTVNEWGQYPKDAFFGSLNNADSSLLNTIFVVLKDNLSHGKCTFIMPQKSPHANPDIPQNTNTLHGLPKWQRS